MNNTAPARRPWAPTLLVTLFGLCVILLGMLLFAHLGSKTTELSGSQPAGVGAGIMVNEALFILVTLIGLQGLQNPPHLGSLRKALVGGISGGAILLLADIGLSAGAKLLGFQLGLEGIFLPTDPTDLAVWLSALLLVPLGEEGFFRGLLPALYEKVGAPGWLSALLCCALFGLIHGGQQPAAIAIAFLMGYGFIALKRFSGGLLAPMLAHFIVDAVGLYLLLHSPPLPAL